MAPDIELVIKLQRLDNRITELRREIAALPNHIAEIEKTLTAHQRKLEADQAALAANQKERRKLENDVQALEEKISRLKDQMLEAKTNEQYRAFQKEIDYCENEIRKGEDRILDLMAASEPLEERLADAERELEKEKEHAKREKKAAQEKVEAARKLLEQHRLERQQTAAGLNSRIYSIYERLRKKYHGAVVAEGNGGKCSACNIALRPQFYQDLKRATEPMVCESCGRLLYYNPTADQESEAQLSHPA